MTAATQNQNLLLTYTPPICGNCGYSLAGHPPESSCPECNLSYGPNHIIFFAWKTGWGVKAIAKKIHWILFGWMILSLLIIAYKTFAIVYAICTLPDIRVTSRGLQQVAVNYLYLVSPQILSLLVLIPFFRIYRRIRAMPAPIQIRLTPSTYAIRGGLGRAKTKPWDSTVLFTLQTKPNAVPIIRFRPRRKWSLDRYLEPITSPELTAQIVAQANSWIAGIENRAK